MCVKRGGRGGGVRPAAVAMATTSRCCRSSGSRQEERVGLSLRGDEEKEGRAEEEPPTPPSLPRHCHI